MARQFVVVVALVLFAVVGFASAAEPAETPEAGANKTDAGSAPGADGKIGNTTDGAAAPGGSNDTVEAPVGEPGAAGASSGPAESPKSGASTVKFSFSAVGGVAAVAGVILF
ncbi:anther-specific protein BCP1-like [Cucurbita maxima]|uniref:Anther-specific protein BCP1-like n=1 Tax=Cucurbita maxima TaxID=3661 RepID=A0A6J1KUU8_CUCMA|nr:anther-specific protein BCP1-like [Cucurbita maxima]